MTRASEIVGRDDEVRAIDRFVGASTPGVLLLEGDAGIGKSTLWRYGVDAASRKWLTLACSPNEAEAMLEFAAAGDLLGAHAGEVVGALPAPQRRALSAALLLDDVRGTPPEPGTVARAFLSALQELGRDRPLLIAVDDVQWLDEPSALLLEFALRRSGGEPIGFLLARRADGDAPTRLSVERIPGDVQRLPLGPLSLGALHRLLRTRGVGPFARPLLRRIHETSGGNPYYALELARALEPSRGRWHAGDPVPITGSLADLVADRLSALPGETRDALLAIALMPQPLVPLLERVVTDVECLTPATEAGIIEFAGDRIRFTHPLVAATLRGRAAPWRVRALHRSLAAVTVDPVQRARHRWLGTDGDDADAAAELAQAARIARARGAPATAAELLEGALRLAPRAEPATSGAWTIEAADAYVEAADRTRAGVLLGRLVESLPAGPARAEALFRLSELADDPELVDRALEEAGEDRRLRARILLQRCDYEIALGQPRRALETAAEALALARFAGDVSLELDALTRLGTMEAITGDGDAEGRLREAQAVETRADRRPAIYWAPGTLLGSYLAKAGELEEARELLELQYRRALEAGDDDGRATLCKHLVELELIAGRWRVALRYANEGRELGEQSGGRHLAAYTLHPRALVHAHLGDADLALALADEGRAIAASLGEHLYVTQHELVRGLVEVSRARFASAADAFASLPLADEAIDNPYRVPWAADAVEAFAGAGRLEEAEALLGAMERRTAELRRAAPLRALAERARGLFEVANDRLASGLEHLEAARAEHERLPFPFERARTAFALGQVSRRARKRGLARNHLVEALAGFEKLGATIWAERARDELARIAGRGASATGLTPAEGRVAELASRGLATKEIASTLAVSAKTVEGHLSRIYAKLDVRSRAELAHRLASPS